MGMVYHLQMSLLERTSDLFWGASIGTAEHIESWVISMSSAILHHSMLSSQDGLLPRLPRTRCRSLWWTTKELAAASLCLMYTINLKQLRKNDYWKSTNMRINWEKEFNEHQWISRKTISITMQIIWKLIIWSMIINDKPPGRDSTTLPANARGLFGDGMEDWSRLWKNIWTYHVLPIIYPQFPSSHVVVISFWWIYRVWILYTNISLWYCSTMLGL